MDTANIGDVRAGVEIFLVSIFFFFCSSPHPRLLYSFRVSLSVRVLRMVFASWSNIDEKV